MLEQESYTCPKCGMTSYHPDDVKHEYCGNCHKTRRELEMEDYLKKKASQFLKGKVDGTVGRC